MLIGNFSKVGTRVSESEYICVADCGMRGAQASYDASFASVTERYNGRSVYGIVFVEKGTVSAFIGNDEVTAKKGNIVLFYPEDTWKIRLSDPDSVYRYVDFTGYAVPEILLQCGLSESGVYDVSDSGIVSDTLARIMLILARGGTEIRINSLLMHLLAEIASNSNPETSGTHSEVVCLEKIHTARKLMDAEYRNARKISEYARICSMSAGRFSAVFEKAIGKTPKKYIEDIKIDKACELLRHTTMTVATAAQSSGFTDPLYFSRVFKKRIGISPTEYRQLPSGNIV